MPATAGPAGRMPAGNRLSTSDSLATHDVWKKSVGHDPYAGAGDDDGGHRIPEVGEINSTAKGLFRLAQLTGNSSTIAPGACKRCGQVGHLYMHCRNYMSLKKTDLQQMAEEKDEDEDEDEKELGSSSSDDSGDSDDSDESSDGEDESSSSGSSSSSSSSSAKKGKKRKRKDKDKSSKKKKSKSKKKEKKKAKRKEEKKKSKKKDKKKKKKS